MATPNKIYREPNAFSAHLSLDVDVLKLLAQLFGMNILEIIIAFATDGEEGSRLTLQKNRDGFTVQVTGAVHKTKQEQLDPQRLVGIRELLSP